ncbi:GTPase [Cycloclasticus sp. 44_32_T64]|nr:GTPase [Cycloclasticus sp. 44_32_T64]
MNLDAQLRSYDLWKQSMSDSIHDYQRWLDGASLSDTETELMLIKNLRLLEKDSITIAFAAEFSRGKTELINALFFSSAGIRLLPSSPGRTTMCPTEIFYDATEKPYLRLLDIETRLSDKSLEDFKKEAKQWTHIELNCDSPEQMQDSFLELLKTKTVSADQAKALGLAGKEGEADVVIPFWRHALISFPHPLLEKGLTILDTPGLNALGSEPELTLSMLPNAQAMIFVLAADTGVTQSDMAMWEQHIQAYRSKHPHGLAVVLNKIDTLNDELMSDDEWLQSIHKQTMETARLLELDEQAIFPLSAKQALIAKIKSDEGALSTSRLSGLENFLSDRILSSQKEILQHKVVGDIVENIELASHTLTSRLQNVAKHTGELRGICSKSELATAELLLETRQEQTVYNKNLTHLKTSRHIFYMQIADLLEVVSPERVAGIVDEGREQMIKSWTSVGIRQGMQNSFDGLNSLLNETLSTTQASIKLLDAIYKRFKDEHDLDVEQPNGFDVTVYQRQLEQLLREGIEFSTSSSAALTEQNTLAKRFVDTIGGQAMAIFKQAQADVNTWKSVALSNLIREVNEQKRFMESKLESLRSVSASRDELDEKIAQNKAMELVLTDQLDSLQTIFNDINSPAIDEAAGLEFREAVI